MRGTKLVLTFLRLLVARDHSHSQPGKALFCLLCVLHSGLLPLGPPANKGPGARELVASRTSQGRLRLFSFLRFSSSLAFINMLFFFHPPPGRPGPARPLDVHARWSLFAFLAASLLLARSLDRAALDFQQPLAHHLLLASPSRPSSKGRLLGSTKKVVTPSLHVTKVLHVARLGGYRALPSMTAQAQSTSSPSVHVEDSVEQRVEY